MRFPADMGVDVRVVEWLRQQTHDAKHLRDEGLHRAPDDEIFAKAVAEERVVLTFDLDFGEIAALTKGRKASVILFIPEEIRRRLGLKAGAQFVVVGEGDVVGLKAVQPPTMDQFDALVAGLGRRPARPDGPVEAAQTRGPS